MNDSGEPLFSLDSEGLPVPTEAWWKGPGRAISERKPMPRRRWYEPPPEPWRTILTWTSAVFLVVIVVLIAIGLTA